MATASVAAAGLSAEQGARQNPPASRTPLLLLAHSNFRANFVAISNGGDNNSQQFHFLKADRVHWRGGGITENRCKQQLRFLDFHKSNPNSQVHLGCFRRRSVLKLRPA